jgi:flagellar export protein FliJ
MAYRFRFQALLKYRQYLLTQAQADLASAMKLHAATQTLLEKTTAERDESLLLFQEKQRSGIAVAEYHLFRNYFVSLEQQLLQLEIELRGLSREVEAAKEILLQRQKELKMLEVTEAKDRSAFRKAQAKKEQISQNERSVIGDYRKRIEL